VAEAEEGRPVQKLFFFATALGALGLLLTGVVLWFPLTFPRLLMAASILLHDVTFILFAVAIVFHIYLGTAALPGTFGAMTRGTVTKAWARLHNPRWYRDVTGEGTRRTFRARPVLLQRAPERETDTRRNGNRNAAAPAKQPATGTR